jgi:hypothetical protein
MTSPKDVRGPEYAFCESALASSLSPWHIRKLSGVGRKLGGGIDTPLPLR